MSSTSSRNTTDFGFQQVPLTEKTGRVRDVFDSVANNYDVMNDLMSLGIHRLWKAFVLEQAQARADWQVLDLAGGTGDLAARFARRVGAQGQVVLADINDNMLRVGRDRLLDQGLTNIQYAQVNAENLPFASNSFHLITIAFGLRNVTDKSAALRSMLRCLKPGGRLLVLEFSEVRLPVLRQLYDLYSFQILPRLGAWVAKDAGSYRYLAESIRMHPNQRVLQGLMEQAGFANCTYHNLTAGVVAVHSGYKV